MRYTLKLITLEEQHYERLSRLLDNQTTFFTWDYKPCNTIQPMRNLTVILFALILAFVLMLTGCDPVKRANKALAKLEYKYPELFKLNKYDSLRKPITKVYNTVDTFWRSHPVIIHDSIENDRDYLNWIRKQPHERLLFTQKGVTFRADTTGISITYIDSILNIDRQKDSVINSLEVKGNGGIMTVTSYVTKPLTRWQNFLIGLGIGHGILDILLIIIGGIAIYMRLKPRV